MTLTKSILISRASKELEEQIEKELEKEDPELQKAKASINSNLIEEISDADTARND